MPKKGSYCVCLSVTVTESVFEKGRNYYPLVILEEYKYIVKEIEVMNTAKTPEILNFETKSGNQICKLIFGKKEKDDDVEILNKMESFYEKLFKRQFFKNVSEIEIFLCTVTTPHLNNDQINFCEKDLSETDLYNAMKNMQNNKSPRNDELTKEFYEGFWDEIKELLIASATEAKQR